MDVLERFPLLNEPQLAAIEGTKDTVRQFEFGPSGTLSTLPAGAIQAWGGNQVAMNRVMREGSRSCRERPKTAEEYAARLSYSAFASSCMELECMALRQILAKYAGQMERQGESTRVEESLIAGRALIDFQAACGADILLGATSHLLGIDPYGLFNQSAFDLAKGVYSTHKSLRVPAKVTEEQSQKIDALVDRHRKQPLQTSKAHGRRGVVRTIVTQATAALRLKREMGIPTTPPGIATLFVEKTKIDTQFEEFLKLDEEEIRFIDRTARKLGHYVERASTFSDRVASNPTTRYLLFCTNNIDSIDSSAAWTQFERDFDRATRQPRRKRP